VVGAFGELVDNYVPGELPGVLEGLSLVYSGICCIAFLRCRQHYALYAERRPGRGNAHRNPVSGRDIGACNWAVDWGDWESSGPALLLVFILKGLPVISL